MVARVSEREWMRSASRMWQSLRGAGVDRDSALGRYSSVINGGK